MTWEAWLTCASVTVMFIALVRNWAPADYVLVAVVTLLVAVGEILDSPKLPQASEAVAGLGNPGLVTVAVLFVVVAGLVQTGAMGLIAGPLLGHPRSVRSAQFRLIAPVVMLSSFLNNTPVVAMFLPVVDDICKRTRISPSKLYLPMAYAATFGGVCTLIGTSTNLVVNGLLIEATGKGMAMFDLTWVGLPCGVAGIAFLLSSGRLLPDRRPPITLDGELRQYTLEMLVLPSGPLVGQTVERAGLRHLPNLFLAEIERDGEVLAAVSPRQRLQGGDRLVFVGVVESVVDLQKVRGLQRPDADAIQLQLSHANRLLIEVVVSERCPLIGTTIRDGQFRSVYNAAVVAVGRGNHKVEGKIGDVVLQAGDTLLIEADEDFVQRQHNSNHFYLISGVKNSYPVRHDRVWLALGVTVAMVTSVAIGWLQLLTAALIAAGTMITFKCCSLSQARQSVDWPLLVVIAASLGIGRAIEQSGLAAVVSSQLIALAGSQPWVVLLAVYVVTMIATELVTNNAAAVIVFPIALSAAQSLDANPMPFIVAIAVAASAGFATPFGYQTNLMVYGPGGYRYSDYMRIGIPLDLIFLLITVAIAPLVWPF